MMTQPKASRFGRESTASEVATGVDLGGKVAVVTGASGGLGAETARVLAERGAHVVLTARELAKGEKVAAEIRTLTGHDRVEVRALELASFESVRACAAALREHHPAIHILVNNAGVMACPLARTARGFEVQFATNHLGHFLLTCLLVPALEAGAPARVVSVSSAGHRLSPVVFEDIHYERRPYDKWTAYGQSKTANVLFALELDRRLRRAGVRAFAVHPGAIITDLGRHLSQDDIRELLGRAPGGQMRWKSVAAGAATAVWAATAPELAEQGGLYLEDCHVAGPKTTDDAPEGYGGYALDPQAAARLWAASEEMVGARFTFV
jgi:NAD(P)-dependent dehydrogenase (short-subunit alcohol dehydrogenase family)